MSAGDTIEIGVDEAGRGPFVGDMVIVGVIGPSRVFESLVSIGLKDSKALEPVARRELFWEILSSNVDIVAWLVSPFTIDRGNMNELEYIRICRILKLLSYSRLARSKPGNSLRIYVDEVKGYGESVRECAMRIYGEHVEVVMEPEADARYPAVSAASVIAKVIRDRNIDVLGKITGGLGSGYPSDPASRAWLATIYGRWDKPPVFIRRSWGIVRDIAPGWHIVKHVKHGRRRSRSLLDFMEGSRHGDESTGRGQG
ncbi:ribonuclease HII [Desulfurococcus mucosus]|uniref:Ribonuclease n=1 Tax=Desulfurococcus mucosus (strain ATCC 35584 / DSM 2162 / JCM 9187 / O7/1) TaxID=765177 RepID=E8R736_DESM0|nr:ribonuclease HII [Desulfurococcus mucosus]ADV64469.1 ribonuclease HII [Desulfurococcus mucosus DSM 2162]